jgi:hypothetical protein
MQVQTSKPALTEPSLNFELVPIDTDTPLDESVTKGYQTRNVQGHTTLLRAPDVL